MSLKKFLILSLAPALLILGLCLATSCGSSSSQSLSNTGGISGTGDTSNLSKPILIENFDLAHSSFGEKDPESTDFTLQSLAPVFKITLEDGSDVDAIENIDITLSNTHTGTTVNLTDFRSNILIENSGDNKNFYIFISKSSSISIDPRELHPGASYTYTIAPKQGQEIYLSGQKIQSLQGNIKTRNITFTYPFQKSTGDSVVDLNLPPYQGLKSLTPSFLIHSKFPFASFDAQANDNRFGVLDKIQILVNGISLFKQGDGGLIFEEVSSQSFRISIDERAGLDWGSHYKISLRAQNDLKVISDSGVKNIISEDLPKSIYIHTTER